MKYRKLPVSTKAVLLDHRRPICVVRSHSHCVTPPPTHAPPPPAPRILSFHEPGFVELMVFKSDCLKQHGNVSQRLAACGPRSLAVFVQRCRGCLHTACRTSRPVTGDWHGGMRDRDSAYSGFIFCQFAGRHVLRELSSRSFSLSPVFSQRMRCRLSQVRGVVPAPFSFQSAIYRQTRETKLIKEVRGDFFLLLLLLLFFFFFFFFDWFDFGTGSIQLLLSCKVNESCPE